MRKRKERLIQNWNWREQRCQWNEEGTRRSVTEAKARLKVTSSYCSVCCLLSSIRDRAIGRKVFSYPWAFASSLEHSIPAGTPGWLRLYLSQSSGCQQGPGEAQLSFTPQEPHISPQCTLQILSLFVWPGYEKQQPLHETCRMILSIPRHGWMVIPESKVAVTPFIHSTLNFTFYWVKYFL